MKIIYIENVRIPSERAHAYQIVEQCAWLGRTGHDVTLVNPDRAGGKDVFLFFKLPDRPFTHVTLPTTDWLERAPVFLKPIAYAVQRMTFVRRLRAWARTQQADAWYTRDPAIVDALHAHVPGPWFLELHDAPEHHPRWQRIKGVVRGIIAITEGLKRHLMDLGIPEERIMVAPDGYEPSEFNEMKGRAEARAILGLPQDAFVLFYGGSFYPWKGLDAMIEQWPQTDPRAHLVLIGGPESDAKRVTALVAPEVRERVHVHPKRPHDELVSLYPAANMGLIASSPTHAIASTYTSPLKLFEYLAAGLPVFASDVPTSHEVLDGSVAVFFEPAHMAEALNAIIEDTEWLRSAATVASRVVSRYTWAARAAAISEWLQDRLEAHDRP